MSLNCWGLFVLLLFFFSFFFNRCCQNGSQANLCQIPPDVHAQTAAHANRFPRLLHGAPCRLFARPQALTGESTRCHPPQPIEPTNPPRCVTMSTDINTGARNTVSLLIAIWIVESGDSEKETSSQPPRQPQAAGGAFDGQISAWATYD